MQKSNGHRGCPRSSGRPILSASLQEWLDYRDGLDVLEAGLRVSHPDLEWLGGMRAFMAEADAVISRMAR